MSTHDSDGLGTSRTVGQEPERVMVYVDGMNLYHGVRSTGVRYLWLDVRALSLSMLRPGQVLSGIKYYTSRFSSDGEDDGMVRRQATYLDALDTFDDIEIIEGKFQRESNACRKCGHEWQSYEEKMTDVNIAIGLITDAEDDLYDVAIVVSCDGDLTGPVEKVLSRHPDKFVLVALPPRRRSATLLQAASAHVDVGRNRFRNSQLPDQLISQNGYPLRRPVEWR